MRFLTFLVAAFLLLSSFQAWAAYWLAGRWFVSSRFASLSLATVKSWLDRGIVSGSTQTAKVFIQKNGKLILLTLGLSQVIPEVERLSQAGSFCYVPISSLDLRAGFTSDHRFVVYDAYYQIPPVFYTASVQGNRCVNTDYIPSYVLYRYDYHRRRWLSHGRVPAEGTFTVGQERDTGRRCQVTISLNIPRCPFTVSSSAPSDVDAPAPSLPNLNQERRRVPVRVFPRVEDFVRPDVVEGDPALRWLRDEYQRIASDSSIPTIPSDALGDLDVPSIDSSISPDEAIDHASESSRDLPREGEGSREGSQDAVDIPGLDTNLPSVERKPFPVELINSLVQNHPLLRILSNLNFDPGSGGSCVIGSGVFTIDFCDHAWVLNLMGAIIVPVAFIVGFIGWRNE